MSLASQLVMAFIIFSLFALVIIGGVVVLIKRQHKNSDSAEQIGNTSSSV